VIRHNVFLKNDRPSGDGDRPNVLVGGFPASGAGSEDRYEIYGNLFADNPRESLLQASGRVTIHDNIFVKGGVNAIVLRNHDLPFVMGLVYNNTIYDTATGIRFGNAATQGDPVLGILVFSPQPITGSIADNRENIVDIVANAGQHVNLPSTVLGMMDFYPIPGKAEGSALDMTKLRADRDFDRDFNGTSKGAFTFRGAYAGAGTNPGWKPTGEPKPIPGSSDGGADAGMIPDASVGGDEGGRTDASLAPDARATPDASATPDAGGRADAPTDSMPAGEAGVMDTPSDGSTAEDVQADRAHPQDGAADRSDAGTTGSCGCRAVARGATGHPLMLTLLALLAMIARRFPYSRVGS
jgi:hypothetical protein